MVSGMEGGEMNLEKLGGSECTVKGFTCYTMGFGFYSANVVVGGP